MLSPLWYCVYMTMIQLIIISFIMLQPFIYSLDSVYKFPWPIITHALDSRQEYNCCNFTIHCCLLTFSRFFKITASNYLFMATAFTTYKSFKQIRPDLSTIFEIIQMRWERLIFRISTAGLSRLASLQLLLQYTNNVFNFSSVSGIWAFYTNWNTSDAAGGFRDWPRLHLRHQETPAHDHLWCWQSSDTGTSPTLPLPAKMYLESWDFQQEL